MDTDGERVNDVGGGVVVAGYFRMIQLCRSIMFCLGKGRLAFRERILWMGLCFGKKRFVSCRASIFSFRLLKLINNLYMKAKHQFFL